MVVKRQRREWGKDWAKRQVVKWARGHEEREEGEGMQVGMESNWARGEGGIGTRE